MDGWMDVQLATSSGKSLFSHQGSKLLSYLIAINVNVDLFKINNDENKNA